MKISFGGVAMKFRLDVLVALENCSFEVLIEFLSFISCCKLCYIFSDDD
ncbi:hypothetical protein Pint_31847 [Pistacia integerrima]|uniref:Uncharacterized protein n=1 Tax=Pistacia integerrima TaxID=434235 RepID=A0ACC0XQ99_9ROSI|nr:hypothetical protein Pint_31847 [Pistacia integerrima]